MSHLENTEKITVHVATLYEANNQSLIHYQWLQAVHYHILDSFLRVFAALLMFTHSDESPGLQVIEKKKKLQKCRHMITMV